MLLMIFVAKNKTCLILHSPFSFRYYETVKDDERAEDEKKVREKHQTKTSESIKKNKSKSNADDGDIESEKRVKKPNPKITRIKV